MKILISGGTGLVGTALGKKLVERGHELFVLTRQPEKSGYKTPYPHTPIYWDATKNSPPSDVISKMEGVIHLAGVGVADKRWTDNYKNKIFNSRVIGTQNLVRAVNDHGSKVQFFISTSAIGYYGESHEEALNEDASEGHSFLSKVCVGWESPVDNFLHEKIRKVIFRIGVVFGKHQSALQEMTTPIVRGIGGPLGGGQQLMSWIDLKDLVNMYLHGVESSISGTFNAVSPNPIANQDLTQKIANFYKTSAKIPVPRLALRAVVGEMANILVASQNISCRKIQDAGFKFEFQDIESSLQKNLTELKPSEKIHFFEQWVPKTPEEVFPFFSDPYNLEKLTPPFLNFKILQTTHKKVEQDSMIEYQIKISGIPMSWVTKIVQWTPPTSFIDNQESGPYKKWHHTHRFTSFANGVLLTDEIQSIVPLGRFGLWTAGHKVYNDVQKIFDFRRKAIAEEFGSSALAL